METLRTAVTIILGIALPFAAQRWDRRRLSVEQRSGAWNAASWGAALYAFGPLSMIAWVWVTRHEWGAWRRRGWGTALGRTVVLLVAGAIAAAAVLVGVVSANALVDVLANVLAGEPVGLFE